MKCRACRRKPKDGEAVIPIQTYVTNEKRGDFLSTNASGGIVHLKCVVLAVAPPTRAEARKGGVPKAAKPPQASYPTEAQRQEHILLGLDRQQDQRRRSLYDQGAHGDGDFTPSGDRDPVAWAEVPNHGGC